MKKVGVLVLLFLLAFSLFPLSLAQSNSTNETDEEEASQQQDLGKIDEGFECLEDLADDCRDLSTQEIALTIMAGPKDSVYDDCLDELKSREASNNWGNIRDTALAIIALEHSGESTANNEEWLIEKAIAPRDLIWYLEQDSAGETACRIGYDSRDYNVNINEDKKIDRNAGPCLSRTPSSFWFEVSSTCFEKNFQLECDKDFIATFLYRNKNSPTVYVLEDTESSKAFGSLELSIDSKCFGSSSCDYEGSLWAIIALINTGHDVKEFLPYIIAMSDTNEHLLPEAFIYMSTNYEDYANELMSNIKLGNYWLAPRSSHNKFYDTSLALLAIGNSNSEQITKSKDWLLFSQGDEGCWQNSVTDTAMALWALEGRLGRSSGGGSAGGVTYCSEASYFCIPKSECVGANNVGNNYFCASPSDTCCIEESLKSCSEWYGKVCDQGKVCTGIERKTTDASACCTGQCVEPSINQKTSCEEMFYQCESSCSEFQEAVTGYECNGIDVCCRSKTNPDPDPKPNWIIWLLVILIIILAIAIVLWIFRKKLKAWWGSKKKPKGGGPSQVPMGPGGPRGPRRPRGPPRRPPVMRRPVGKKPGFPPIRRAPTPKKSAKKRVYDKRDPEMSETFKKLREMSK